MQFGKKFFKKKRRKKAGVAAPLLLLPWAAAFSLFLPHFPITGQSKPSLALSQVWLSPVSPSIGKLMEHPCDHFAASDQLKKKKEEERRSLKIKWVLLTYHEIFKEGVNVCLVCLALSHLALINSMRSQNSHLHFTEEENEALSDGIVQVHNGRAYISAQIYLIVRTFWKCLWFAQVILNKKWASTEGLGLGIEECG